MTCRIVPSRLQVQTKRERVYVVSNSTQRNRMNRVTGIEETGSKYKNSLTLRRVDFCVPN